MIGISHPYLSQTFLIVALLKFILFSIFELRYMLTIWKSHNPQDMTIDEFRSSATQFYMQFYIFICFGIFLYQYYFVALLYFIILHSGWVFQIYHVAKHNYRRKIFTNLYFYGSFISRTVVPLMAFISPGYIRKVIFDNKYYPFSAFFFLLWLLIQGTILKLQERYGPRFFFPKSMLQPMYDYHRDIPEALYQIDEESNERTLPDCVICMNNVFFNI